MGNNRINLLYIEESGVSGEEYLSFLVKHYGNRAIQKYTKRFDWYKKQKDYRVLLAINNKTIVGQSCAFKNTAIIHNKETEIWWGIDVFVLPEARGRGIGKLMQKKLHADLKNFCSAWYSPVNGIVKRKCGSKELFSLSFSYYPVSSFFSYLTSLVIKKIFKKQLVFNFSIPFIYTSLNKKRKLQSYDFRDIELDRDDVYEFIRNSTINKSDFYIKRDREYLKWRYLKNPNLKYHIIEILHRGKREAILIFTHIHKQDGLYVTKFMDTFKTNISNLTEKDYHIFIGEYFKRRHQCLDGILSLFDLNYFPKVTRRSFFLSNMQLDTPIKSPYISYSDQDMVQMY